MPAKEVQALIDTLDLKPHPEGGFYKETYRSDEIVQRTDSNNRAAGTGIYFLLPQQICTSWHRVRSDELWHFYKGDQLILEIIKDGSFHRKNMHDNPKGDMMLQELVPSGCWQRAYSTGRYSLCGCTVSPGFEFEDFEMIKTDELASQFPGIASQITYNPFSK